MSAHRVATTLDSDRVYIEANCTLQADGQWLVNPAILRTFDEKQYPQLFDRDVPPALLGTTLLPGIRGGLQVIWSHAKATKNMFLYLDSPVRIWIHYQEAKPRNIHIVVGRFVHSTRPPARGRQIFIKPNSRYTALALFASRDPEYQKQLSDDMGKYVHLMRQSAHRQLPSWLREVHEYGRWVRGERSSVQTFSSLRHSTNHKLYPGAHDGRGYAGCTRGEDMSLGTPEEWAFPEELRARVQAYIQLGALVVDPTYLPLLSPEVAEVPSIAQYAFELSSHDFESVCAMNCPFFETQLTYLRGIPQGLDRDGFVGWIWRVRAEWKAMKVSPEVAGLRARTRMRVWTAFPVEVWYGQLSGKDAEYCRVN
ncbi:hypothetical protein DFH06DRAFT_1188005 [Mycena polygramma]|nr:hypothetical protein DFH06DRAFT_1188005 [Mycena polygramma]